MVLDYGVYYVKYLEDGWIKERGSFSKDPFNQEVLDDFNEWIKDGLIEILRVESLKDEEDRDEW